MGIKINGNERKRILAPQIDGKYKYQEVNGFFGWYLQVGDKVEAFNYQKDTLYSASWLPTTFVGMLIQTS